MAALCIRLFGPFEVELDGEPLSGFVSDKARALLAYLAVEADRPHRREALAGLLWPEVPERSARGSLSTALGNVRQLIGDSAPSTDRARAEDRERSLPFLYVSRQEIQFNRDSDARVDVREFAGLLQAGTHQPSERPLGPLTSQDLEEAVGLCRGSFLEGFSVADGAPFEEWALLKREQLQRQVLAALHQLISHYERSGEISLALPHAWRAADLDPWRGDAQCQLMHLLALNGQREAALAQYEQHRQLLAEELGVEPSEAVQELYKLLSTREWPGGAPRAGMLPERAITVVGPCPYRGLAAFREEDAPFFFGRAAFVEQLSEMVGPRASMAAPLVAIVVGSSGCGKSSAVYAGLLPRLREQGNWLIASLRPGSRPFHALAVALLPMLEPGLDEIDQLVKSRKLADALRGGELSLHDLVQRILEKQPEARSVMLVADQFEELYTLTPEPEVRRRFLDDLLAAVEASAGQREHRLALLVTIRADFMGQALAYRPFADALQEASLMLGPMNREEMRSAVEQPAEVQEAAFEAGLVERILDDVGEEPGKLPLLEFALTLLWERQIYGWMTHDGYEEIGRVGGALARYADEVYEGLIESEREQARKVFVQLVRPGEGTEDTRRVATRAELGDENWALVQHLADRRLVVTGRDEGGTDTAEVVHEALIQGWELLQGWAEADRAFRTWQERLRAALREWEASQRDEGALLRGAPLAEAEGWLSEREDELSPSECAYISASQALSERRAAERDRRRRRIMAGLAVGLLIALFLALLVGQQWFRAEGELAARATAQAEEAAQRAMAESNAKGRATAQAEAESAEEDALRQASIGLASQALTELDGNFPERAIPLALEALEDYPYTWQAERALGQAVLEHRVELVLAGHTGEIYYVAWSPDGTQIATASDDGTAIVWDGVTGERLATLAGHEEAVYNLSWSPSGRTIATASDDGTAKMWDAETGEDLLTLSGHEGPVGAVVWSPLEDRAVTVGYDSTARVWDAATGKELLVLAHGVPAIAAAWSPLGTQVVIGDSSGGVIVWDSETGEELLVLEGHEESVNDVFWAPSADRIVTASSDHTARVWDASTGEELQVLTGHRDEVWRAMWSPAGDRLVTTALDASTRVWDPATGEAVLSFHPGDASHLDADVDWSPSGDQVASIRSDLGSVTVLDVETGIEVVTLTGHTSKATSLDWSPTGPLIVTGSEDYTARVWDVSPRAQVLTGHTQVVFAVAWSPSGDRLAAAGLDGTARIWDAATGDEVLAMRGPAEMGGVMWSPSGDRLATDPWFADPTVVIWDVSPSSPTYGEELLAMESHYGGIGRSWSPIDDRFITTGFDGTARIWDATSGEALLTFEGHGGRAVTGADWSPDGQRIVTSCEDGDALVWDPTTGEVLLTLDAEEASWMTRAAWSPDGTLIATYSEDTAGGRVWDASNGELLLTFSGHAGGVFGLDWCATGERLLTVSNDGTARIWDAVTGAELLSYSFGPQLTEGAWSPDMKQIALSAADGKIRIVDVHWNTTDELIAYARECCLIRELTANERELFGLPPR
jgi:WD40 repeat protein/DNA-binding SARP family transcriptional activator